MMQIKEELSYEQKKLEQHKLANLCYLVKSCTEEDSGKNKHITKSEYRLLVEWCKSVDLDPEQSTGILERVIRNQEDKNRYIESLETIANYYSKIDSSITEEQLQIALDFFQDYKNNYERITFDQTLEEMMHKKDYDFRSAAVELTEEQFKVLRKVAYKNWRIDEEERALIKRIVDMNEVSKPLQNSQEYIESLFRGYSTKKSLLICLQDNTSDIKDILETVGYAVGTLGLKTVVSSFQDDDVSLSLLTGIGAPQEPEKPKNLIEYEINSSEGFIPNMIILDPTVYFQKYREIDGTSGSEEIKGIYISRFKNELRSLIGKFGELQKEMPVILYTPQEYAEYFGNMSLNNMHVIARKDISDIDIEDLQHHINNTYELIEDAI